MRRLFPVIMIILSLCPTLSRATTYRFAAIKDGNLCLIAKDCKTTLPIAKRDSERIWDSFTVSPDGKAIIAFSRSVRDSDMPASLGVARIDLPNGDLHDLPHEINWAELPETPVWLSNNITLLGSWNSDGTVYTVNAVDTTTGNYRTVIKPNESNFRYDNLLVSPSGKLIATRMGITAAWWFSVSELTTGNRYWETTPDRGLVGAFGNVIWSVDSRSLLVPFVKYDSYVDTKCRGGLWKFDARTGKQRVWKYRGKEVIDIADSPNHQTLAVDLGNHIDFLTSSGRFFYRFNMKKRDEWVQMLFAGNDRFVYGTTERILILDLHSHKTRYVKIPVSKEDADRVMTPLLSPDSDKVIYRLYDGGVADNTWMLDLNSGITTSFDTTAANVAWLPKPIVR